MRVVRKTLTDATVTFSNTSARWVAGRRSVGARVSRPRILLVGGNDDFLDGLMVWIARDGQFEVVGRAHNGLAALDQVAALRADVVLMDVTLPDVSGFEVARRVKSRDGAPLVVLLSFHDSQAARLEAWSAGADGFVSKSETADRLIPLIGDLLRQRHEGVPESDSGISKVRVPPTEVSE